MKLILSTRILANFFVVFALISCKSVSVQQYPVDWPPLVAMSETCTEVSGTYIDPNTWKWERIDPKTQSKWNGTREGVWGVFPFNSDTVRPSDERIKSRMFSISFGENSNLIISYFIESKLVESRIYTKDKWSCGKDGLNLITLEKTGVVTDKFPGHGVSVHTVTMNRIDDKLYVKARYTTKNWLLHFIPEYFETVSWLRFQLVDIKNIKSGS